MMRVEKSRVMSRCTIFLSLLIGPDTRFAQQIECRGVQYIAAPVEWTKSVSRPAAYSTNCLSLFFYNLQTAPGIQRVIDFKLVFQILHIFREAQTIARGDRFQS